VAPAVDEYAAAMQPFRLGTGRVGVVVTPDGDCAPQLFTIQAWARDLGLDVVELGSSADPSGDPDDCRFVVALGGDGTILRALQLAMPDRVPVLGVNFGHVGFLADIGRADLQAALDAIGRGEAQVDERTALVATLEGQEPRHAVAFNDVVVARIPGHGTARLRIEVGGEPLLTLRGDGVVIASPAYTVEAGGPAVSPQLDAIVLTPLATQGSPLRSMVLNGTDTVRIEMDAASAPLGVELDGRTAADMRGRYTALEVHAAPGKARLLRTRPRTFYADLAGRL
jgi:NAD+ kinase